MGENGAQLLKLPPKAVDNLLNHLNVFHLMNLRLVCKATKNWVELPDHLKRFFVHVKTRKFLQTLKRSAVKWSNVTLECDTDNPTNTSWIEADIYFDLFVRLSASLRVLRFTEQRLKYNGGLDVILRNCVGLETLEIGTLDLQKVTLPMVDDAKEHLVGLKELGISYVAWDQEKDLAFLGEFLEASPNLYYFRLPFILSSSVYNIYPSLDVDEVENKLNEITDRYLFSPVKKLLRQENSKLKRLQVENFEVEQLFQNELLLECQKSGCLILNLMECLEESLPENQIALLGSTLGSLVNLSKFLNFSKLEHLQSLALTEDADTDKQFLTENSLPNLTSISITLTTTILQAERIAFCFLQQKRPSVRSVTVAFSTDLRGSAQASVFRTPKFAASFPNLVKLSLNGFTGKAEDYHLLWNGFPELEELQLENCSTCGDSALIGEDKQDPVFLQLTKLKRLSLEYCGDLTDLSLSSVISHIPLETLSLAQPKLTYSSSGLLCLTNDKLPLHKSLMQFHCLKPEDDDGKCTEQLFSEFLSLKSFVNLKKSEILF